MAKTLQRMGDGRMVEMTEAEVRKDIEEGTKDAASRAKIPPLSEDEIKHILDIYTRPERIVGVEPGNEVVLSSDEGTVKINAGVCGGAGLGIDCGRTVASELYERALGADIIEYGHIDYSFKPIRPILADERILVERALLVTTAPFLYGAMPNLGLYTQPEGPFPNPTELLNKGLIKEARESGERMVEQAINDMVYIASGIYEAGADAINFDTTGAFGDLDFAAALTATERLKKKYPDMCIEMGMAGEFVLGIHGTITYDGVRLAGLYPHQQVKLAEKAGVTIFGPVCNIVTSRSCAWNIARVITFTKACAKASKIPIHNNMGMGVGGIPLNDTPPVDAVTRASKAAVEICQLDGVQVGIGDIHGMLEAHAMASGMGGMRTAGDLVARMEMARGMRIKEAKEYVASKLKVSIRELSDPIIMSEVRDNLKLGLIAQMPGRPKGIEAKFRIAELLGIEINSVNRFKEKAGLPAR